MRTYIKKNTGVNMELPQLIGAFGMLLIFSSFIVKAWKWLYTLNFIGTIFLATYAYILGDIVFMTMETGILLFLTYRIMDEIRNDGERTRERCNELI